MSTNPVERTSVEDLFVERVTDEGYVYFRLPSGRCEVRRVAREEVPRYRELAARSGRQRPSPAG